MRDSLPYYYELPKYTTYEKPMFFWLYVLVFFLVLDSLSKISLPDNHLTLHPPPNLSVYPRPEILYLFDATKLNNLSKHIQEVHKFSNANCTRDFHGSDEDCKKLPARNFLCNKFKRVFSSCKLLIQHYESHKCKSWTSLINISSFQFLKQRSRLSFVKFRRKTNF